MTVKKFYGTCVLKLNWKRRLISIHWLSINKNIKKIK